MDLSGRSVRASAIIAVVLAITSGTSTFVAPAGAATPGLVAVGGGLRVTGNTYLGAYTSSGMSVEVVLAPRDQARLNAELAAVYSPGGGAYQKWLGKGQFDALYAPSDATRNSVSAYLGASGLTVTPSSSPFLIRAVGSSVSVSAAFHTTLGTYRTSRGVRYFANSATVRLPSTLASGVLGVVGLTDTVRLHPALSRPAVSSTSCATGYPTRQQIFTVGGRFLSGYGGGPHCSGLTPSQVNSIYAAPHVGARGRGAGVDLAVFEESAYLESDIATWTRQFYGAGYHAPLANIAVDGGSLNPVCPSGDTCPVASQGYAGDIEADADIEEQLTVAPDARHILAYNAPFDTTGQTALDEFTAMAADDAAAVVSSSYGQCENDVGAAYAQAENVIFEQMALQGQSVFSASGDSGAFDCLNTDGTTIVNVDDPPSQPWVTSVGGTSLESDDPGTAEHPPYPRGVETVLNVDNLCNTSPDEGGQSGFFWCSQTGAGGGGSSQFWGRPFYQQGPGIDNPFTTYGNGTTRCSLAATGTPCREVPDVSANADGFTGYAMYCTGGASTPNSVCAQIPAALGGWFPVGGTSLSSPLWSGIVADRDSFQGHRTGNLNPLVYRLYRSDPERYFHDITGVGPLQAAATNNGLFPTTPGYDLATGVGTPEMTALITSGRTR